MEDGLNCYVDGRQSQVSLMEEKLILFENGRQHKFFEYAKLTQMF